MSTKPRTRLRPEARRAELLSAAAEAFASRSYEAVTMSDIAASAGVSKGLVFRYFPTKGELYREVLQVGVDRARAASDPDPSLPAAEQFRIGLDGYVAVLETYPHALPALEAGGSAQDPEVRRLILAGRDAVADRIISRMGVEQPPKRLRHAVRTWLEFVRLSATAWVADPEVSRDELIELQVATFRAAVEAALGDAAADALLP